jgi:hypothetical protein
MHIWELGTPFIEDHPEWNPGGWLAKKKGCTCPRLDNRFGEGRLAEDGDTYFIIDPTCPLHADPPSHDPAIERDTSNFVDGW